MGKISAWYQGSIEQTALAGCWDQSELGQPGKETTRAESEGWGGDAGAGDSKPKQGETAETQRPDRNFLTYS